jgi:hypothetical protein
VGGRIILKYILEKQNGYVDWIHLVHGRDQWMADVGIEPLCSLNCWKFVEWLSNFWIFKTD